MIATLALPPRNTAGMRMQLARDTQRLARIDGSIAALMDLLRARLELPSGPVYARCRCGREYSEPEWTWLHYCGHQDDGEGATVPLRNCFCGSTIAPLWASEPEHWAQQKLQFALGEGVYNHDRNAREREGL